MTLKCDIEIRKGIAQKRLSQETNEKMIYV